MSEHIRRKANEHKVKHLFSGKDHFFEVDSGSGEKYSVSIKVNCDCRFMGVQGVANADICSHVLAVINKISQKGQIKTGGKEDGKD